MNIAYMRKLIFFLLLCMHTAVYSQNWAWLKGPFLVYQESKYGIQNVLSSTNSLGARQGGSSWYLNGDFYTFGGQGISKGAEGYFNDLWKYDSVSKNWVWLKGDTILYSPGHFGTKGIADPANVPCARTSAVSWVYNNEFYLFGGISLVPDDQGNMIGAYCGDLWKYSPSSNRWTWLQGDSVKNTLPVFGTKGIADPANKPGALTDGIGWSRDNKLYLYAGSGIQNVPENTNNGPYNNVWEYDPANNNWTWLNGSGDVVAQLPYFNINNSNDPANNPGGRSSLQGVCTGNEFYIFGGRFILSSVPDFISPTMNDLWKYKHATNTWERVQDAAYDDAGNYGSLGIPAASNRPPARVGGCMSSYNNKLYLFGGAFPPYADHQMLNDLWNYDLNTGLWTWVKGSNQPVQPFGNRGPLGVYQPSNTPGGRASFNSAATRTGFYIFGGNGYFDPNEQTSPFTLGNEGVFGDLWKLDITNTSNNIACGNNKVLVCHIPPGNPANAHTLCISQNAVAAHLAHGDYLGPCTNSKGVVYEESETAATSFQVEVLPNPTRSYFTMRVLNEESAEPIKLVVWDVNGRLVEMMEQKPANRNITIGEKYHSGIYLVQVTQGIEQKTIRLVKL